MTKTRFFRVFLWAFYASFTLAALPALAQEVLEEVVVTAQKRAQNLQDVPNSISTLSGEKLDILSSSGMDIRFLSSRVPSLTIESSFGRVFPRFYIRGLGNTDFDFNSSQPVSLVYDEVVLENPILKGFPVFDLERIEILRGPQGTLFGRNTPAGTVKFESRKPSREFDGFASLSVGEFSTIDFEGAVGGPVSDTVSFRLAGIYQTRDGWVNNTFTGQNDALEDYDEFAVRAQLLIQPDDQLSVLLNVHARDLEGTARVFRANIIQAGTSDFVAGFDRESVSQDGMNTQDANEFGFVGKIDYDFGDITLTSVTSLETAEIFSRGDIDGGFGAAFLGDPALFGPGVIPFTSESADAIPDLDQFTQEIRLTTNDWDGFNFTTGFFYFDENLDIESLSFCTLCGGTLDGFAFQTQKSEAWALFGSLDFDITDQFRLSTGLRFSHDEKNFVAERTLSPLAFLGVGPIGPLTTRTEDDSVAWNINANFAASDDVNVYARLAQGFRAPSIQGRVLFGDVVTVANTETNVSLEAGIKSDLADGRARINVAAFVYKMDDQQLTAVGGGANFNQLVNADTVNGRGFEIDLDYLPIENLLITLGASYNHTEIDDPNLFIQPCGGGCTVFDPAGPIPGTVSIDGNPLPNAPEWIANTTLRYAVPMGAGNELYFYTDWAYRSEINFLLYESAEFRDASLLEGGLRVGYVFNDGDYEIAAFVRNITDDESLEGGIDFNNLTGFVNEPRQWGISGNMRF